MVTTFKGCIVQKSYCSPLVSGGLWPVQAARRNNSSEGKKSVSFNADSGRRRSDNIAIDLL